MTTDSVTAAKELMSIVTTPSALVTGTLLSFAGRALRENVAKVESARMWFASAACVSAVGITGGLAALMAPLAWRSIFIFRGGIEPVLVVYVMITLTVVGTLVYSLWMLRRCAQELRRPSH